MQIRDRILNCTRANLVLVGGNASAEGAESGAPAPQNQWAALRAALRLVGQKPKSFVLVEISGIEPEPRQCECRVIPFYYIP